jgi:hypothetical protein
MLSPTELLNFEAQWPHHTPDKGETVRRELGITPVRYYQRLNPAVYTIDGVRADPITARRVRERIERRATERGRRVA